MFKNATFLSFYFADNQLFSNSETLDFNLAACFSCLLTAETACEAMNLGLDRRVLVDEEIGYFKNIYV